MKHKYILVSVIDETGRTSTLDLGNPELMTVIGILPHGSEIQPKTVKDAQKKLNHIATVADNLARGEATKKIACAIVRKLISSPESIDDQDLAVLYKQFTPATPAKPKNDYDWVSLAMGKNDVRYYLNHIYCDGSRIMATDGHRLHIIDNYLNLEPGFYDKNKAKIEVDASFPDVDRVIPSKYGKNIPFSNLEIADYQYEGKNTPIYKINDIAVNAEYKKKAALGFKDPIIYYKNSHYAVYIKDGAKTAVIMPIRIK